jgi:glutamyl-tRNA synthetase
MIQSSHSTSEVRVRFAPSPTGHLHIGGLRSALFNWLYARHFGGKFLLRIEDTDLERSKQEYTDAILEAFAWCAIESDEPLVIQSARKDAHVKIAYELLAKGAAYRCYCTQEELQTRLGSSAAEGGYIHYDGLCRTITTILDKPFVIRCKVPHDREAVVVHDLIRGDISFPLKTIDDFIIVRSDGSPMYNFVVVVDDAFMRITHVIRGEEHLVNTPRQILLYEACGYALPYFAHVPLILGPDGSKLSKRDAATAVIDYKKDGYLADALCNYLIRLGWSHGDQEIFTREEMIKFFSLEHIHKSGAIFDPAKLLWMNHMYMKQASGDALVGYIIAIDPGFRHKVAKWPDEIIQHVAHLYKDRVKTVVELRDAIVALYAKPALDASLVQQVTALQFEALELLIKHLSQSDYTRPELEVLVKQLCQQMNLRMPDIAQPVRLALTGSLSAPGIYDLLLALGKEESIARLKLLATQRPVGQ